MQRRRVSVAAIASLLCLAIIGSGCATTSNTGQVSGDAPEFGARLQTSTTIAGSATGQGRTASRSDSDSTIDGLSVDPDVLAQLGDLTPEELSELTGLSLDELGELGISPASVGALARVVDSIGLGGDDTDPALVQALLAGGGSLLTGTGQLTSEASGLLASANIDPATLAAIAGAAATVPPGVIDQLGTILAIVDPNGLGQLDGNASALSALAVLIGAALGSDPIVLGELSAVGEIDPRFRDVVGFFTGLVTSFTPALVDRINRITKVLGPYTLQALGGTLALLERPEVADVIADAFSNPAVVATAFGALFTFIPGLPELLAPNAFGDPNAIYTAITAIAAVALLNADAPGFRDLLESLGISIPDELG